MKTPETIFQERQIYFATQKMGVFGCHEVTIGFGGTERVDYMTVDTKGIFRCYEVKVTRSDFHSRAAATFVGHYNYYVMPRVLFEEVGDEIPAHIGIYDGRVLLRPAKKTRLGVCEILLLYSMVRSLSRVYQRRMRQSHREALEIAENALQDARQLDHETRATRLENFRLQRYLEKKGLMEDYERFWEAKGSGIHRTDLDEVLR